MTEYNKHSFRLALLTLKVWAKSKSNKNFVWFEACFTL